MDEILRRLDRLEGQQVNLRMGLCIDDSPLTVRLGGADAAQDYANVSAINGVAPVVDDKVVCLFGRNVLVVLGTLSPTQKYEQDTQSASITNAGAITGISITPVRGKYWAMLSASAETAGWVPVLIIQKNGVDEVSGAIYAGIAHVEATGFLEVNGSDVITARATSAFGTFGDLNHGRLQLIPIS